jgi:type II secretory ATPase GspE/PulE/Tfp pilus assembly ATPase PilB-like protein
MIISQRLAKRLCQHCKVEDEISDTKMKKIKKILENVLSDEDLENLKFYK